MKESKGQYVSQYQLDLLIKNRADPWVYRHSDGYYYFTASVPEYDRIEIRKSRTLKGLETAGPKVIWTRHETGTMSKHIWAPEIHFLSGKWYIYFAAGEADDIWKIRPYVLECTGQDLLSVEWIEKGMIQKAKDDPFSFTEFSLDATTFENGGIQYLLWAQKVNGSVGISNLYIAKMKNPWTLATAQVLISTPDYPWERQGFWVNEGPAVIKRNGRIFISYSASATDHNYCIGLLSALESDDLTDPNVWRKSKTPIFESNKGAKIFGPGHNSFTVSEDGSSDIMIYHARDYMEIQGDPLNDPNRHTRAARLVWGSDGVMVDTGRTEQLKKATE